MQGKTSVCHDSLDNSDKWHWDLNIFHRQSYQQSVFFAPGYKNSEIIVSSLAVFNRLWFALLVSSKTLILPILASRLKFLLLLWQTYYVPDDLEPWPSVSKLGDTDTGGWREWLNSSDQYQCEVTQRPGDMTQNQSSLFYSTTVTHFIPAAFSLWLVLW